LSPCQSELHETCSSMFIAAARQYIWTSWDLFFHVHCSSSSVHLLLTLLQLTYCYSIISQLYVKTNRIVTTFSHFMSCWHCDWFTCGSRDVSMTWLCSEWFLFSIKCFVLTVERVMTGMDCDVRVLQWWCVMMWWMLSSVTLTWISLWYRCVVRTVNCSCTHYVSSAFCALESIGSATCLARLHTIRTPNVMSSLTLQTTFD